MMKNENIQYKPVEGVYVAIINEAQNSDEPKWNVYIINRNDKPIKNILITSKGYGQIDGEERKTSVLRKMIDAVTSENYQLIEPINPSLFQLTNEFWVSYYIDKQIYDKKFIFLPGSFFSENMVNVPIINKKGILHG